MTSVERNGDLVSLASYAPLLARIGHTSWNPNLIYFTGTSVCPTVNYYVQQLFSVNQGNIYYKNVILANSANAGNANDSTLAASCVSDNITGDVILKLVNIGTATKPMSINLSRFNGINPNTTCTILTGTPDAKNTFESPKIVSL